MKMGLLNLMMAMFVLYVNAEGTGSTTMARGKDYCIPGSDSLCKRWGSDYCCARIEMNYNGGNTKAYHACASAAGVAATGGAFSGGPYSGKWYCAGAMEQIQLSILAAILFISATFA